MTLNSEIKEKLKTKNEIHVARKVWHFLGIMIIFVLFNNISRQAALSWSLGLATATLIVDFLRLHNDKLNSIFIRVTSLVIRQREAHTYTGTTALFFGVFAIMYLFPVKVVQMSLLFLAIADPIASYYGVKYGKDKILKGKSLQGSLAAFVTCFLISIVFYLNESLMTERLLIVSLLTGLAGAVSEAITIGRLDDNLTYPIINSFILLFIFKIFGGL